MSNNTVKLALAAMVILVAGGLAGYWFAARQSDESQLHQVAEGRKVLYWHDPMRPDVKFDKPGKSPFMDMQLVPVYADEEPGAAVRVDPTLAQNLGIRLGTVEKAALSPRLSAVGSVTFDEQLVEVVQARVEGYVTRLHVKAPLARVKRGQALAEITAPAWLEAQEEYLALRDVRSERGKSIRDAARERLRVLGVPSATIENLDANGKVDASTTLSAPIEGVVTDLAVREGAAFMPGATLFRINGLGSVWVNAQIPEAQVSMIPMGASVIARATAWPDTQFKGRVLALLPDVDPQTRTLSVRIALDNTGSKLAPGMFVTVELSAQSNEPQLVVPSEAIIVTGERSVVIVARDGAGFDVAEVTTGTELESRTAILSGLQEGQRIVLSGQFLIDSEASLKAGLSRLSGPAERGETPLDQQDHSEHKP